MSKFKISIFSDGANAKEMIEQNKKGTVSGFTTNPSLMAKAGVRDYEGFAKEVLATIQTCPISFEVFSDDPESMAVQARKIRSWGPNVNVKIPIMNTKRQPMLPLIRTLLDEGTKLNVTAIFTDAQSHGLREILKKDDDVIVSIFAGRIADTGVDPCPIMKRAVREYADLPKAKILWASSREVFNIFQAEECGCHIITVAPSILSQLPLIGKSLDEYSLDTVKKFLEDSTKSGFSLH